MKILLVGPNSIHLRNFHRALTESRHEVRVLTQAGGRDWFGDLSEGSVRRIRFGLWNPWRLLAACRAARREARAFAPAVVHAHQLNVYGLVASVAARATDRPLVVTAWGSDVLIGAAHPGILRGVVRRILRRALHTTAESAMLIRRMRQLAPGAATEYHQINLGTPIPRPTQVVRRPLVYSNRLHKPNYNIATILRFFREWVDLRPTEGWQLVVAASGEETDRLKALAEELGISSRTQFVGWLDAAENRAWYEQAELYMSIPGKDSISVSLLEAMALGCIPVVSDIPSNREVVLDSVNGIFLTSAAHVHERLSRLDADRARRINRALVEEIANPERCRRAFDAVYEVATTPR